MGDARGREDEEEQVARLRPVRELLREVFAELEKTYSGCEPPHDLRTGIDALDVCGVSLSSGSVLVLGSRPQVGKTTLATQLAREVLEGGYPVLWLSARAPARDVIHRLLSAESGVSPRQLTRGELDELDWVRAIKAAGVVGDYDLVVADSAVWQLEDILSNVREDRLERDTRLVVLDSIELVRATRELAHEEEVEEVIRALAIAAREHDLTLVVTANLTRVEPGTSPTLSNVRFSQVLERYAGTILLLHRERNPHDRDVFMRDATLIVAHDSFGARGEARLVFRPERQRFEEP